MKKNQVIIDSEKCVGCGLCSEICAAHNLVISNKKANTVMNDCIKCGQCSAVCPKKAISIMGYGNGQVEKTGFARLNPDEVLNTICFRRSIRNFKKTEISKDIIEQILEAGRLTPYREK